MLRRLVKIIHGGFSRVTIRARLDGSLGIRWCSNFSTSAETGVCSRHGQQCAAFEPDPVRGSCWFAGIHIQVTEITNLGSVRAYTDAASTR